MYWNLEIGNCRLMVVGCVVSLVPCDESNTGNKPVDKAFISCSKIGHLRYDDAVNALQLTSM